MGTNGAAKLTRGINWQIYAPKIKRVQFKGIIDDSSGLLEFFNERNCSSVFRGDRIFQIFAQYFYK